MELDKTDAFLIFPDKPPEINPPMKLPIFVKFSVNENSLNIVFYDRVDTFQIFPRHS